MNIGGLTAQIRSAADQCVKCGLCLPACPTYAIAGREAESPRGRIGLLQAIADQPSLAVDGAMTRHLDHCLSCRACERVCPAGVAYGQLFDTGQALLHQHQRARGGAIRHLQRLLSSPRRRRLLLRVLWLLQRLGLATTLIRVLPASRLARGFRLLPTMPWPRRMRGGMGSHASTLSTPSKEDKAVVIFGGCFSDSADAAAITGFATLLTHAGYRVQIPTDHGCCGALAQHAGQPDIARGALASSAARMDAMSDAHIVAVASGCAAWLQDAAALPATSPPMPDLVSRHASAWRLLKLAPHPLAFARRDTRVAVWAACTQRNVTRDDDAMMALLQSVAGANIRRLPIAEGCCGAAGLQCIDAPETADRLASSVIAGIRIEPPDVVLCANVGCRLHLAAALREAGMAIPVRHPADWLAETLPTDTETGATTPVRTPETTLARRVQ